MRTFWVGAVLILGLGCERPTSGSLCRDDLECYSGWSCLAEALTVADGGCEVSGTKRCVRLCSNDDGCKNADLKQCLPAWCDGPNVCR